MIHDRTYMSPNYGNREMNPLFWIIGINVGIFVIQCFEHAIQSNVLGSIFTLSSVNIERGFIWTPLTYSFLHSTSFLSPGGGFLPWHILGNMVGVYFIGRMLLPILGKNRFFQLYFSAALVGGLFWLISNYIFGPSNLPLVGASGSVMGLIAMFALLYPNREMTFYVYFLFPVKLKPKYIGLIVLAIAVLGYLAFEIPGDKAGTAHSAHLGGMLGGWLFYKFIYSANIEIGRGFSIQMPAWLKRKSAKPVAKNKQFKYTVNISKPDEIKQEVDRILDKINSQGFGSLSPKEKQTLDEARDILNRH